MTQAPSKEDRYHIQAQVSVGFQEGSSRTCLLSWLIRGRDHHCVADGERNEEVKNVRQLGREVVQRVLLVPRRGQAPAALMHLLQQLRVGCYVLLLRRTQRPGVSLTQGPAHCSLMLDYLGHLDFTRSCKQACISHIPATL